MARNIHIITTRAGLLLGTELGAIIAGLSLTRSMLVLGHDVRVKHFTIRFVPILAAGLLVGCLLPPALAQRWLFHRKVVSFTMNPTAQYALVSEAHVPRIVDTFAPLPQYQNDSSSYGYQDYLLRRSDQRRVNITYAPNWHWITADVAVGNDWRSEKMQLFNASGWHMQNYQIEGSGWSCRIS
jgi:hypothetical protein